MNWLDRTGAAVAQVSLAALCLIPAWFFGGRLPELRVAISLAAAVGMGAAIVRVVARKTAPFPIPGLAVCVLMGALLGALQLWPQPASVGRPIAPQMWSLRSELTSDEPETQSAQRNGAAETSSREAEPSWPLSLYPAWTRRTVWMLFLCAGIVLVSADTLGRPSEARLSLMAVGLNGAALAVFGLAQQFTWSGKIYGLVPLPPDGGSPFGPFMNRNNAGGFLNLCLAAAVGAAWLSWKARPSAGADTEKSPVGARRFSAWDRLLEVFAQLNGAKLLYPVAAVFIVAGIASSLSRGATLAMLFALATLTAIGFGRRMPGRTVLVFAVASLAVLLLAWLGRIDPINERLQTLTDLQKAGAGRLDNWSDALKLVPDFWLTGTGLGTYRFVYTIHEQRACEVWFYHAENQFIETLIELGVLGLGLLVAAIGIAAVASVRLLRSEREWAAVGLAGLMMLVSQ
ncbi:MAG TPA: O-antigen ligase domain-containing protein, partial [Planctomycetaceae bacterium]|nr:O-antigen ligase domain-containing protein [Planctomycetaceae bacterium]